MAQLKVATLPGFTAEASLREPSETYRDVAKWRDSTDQRRVIPQWKCDCLNCFCDETGCVCGSCTCS
jgi:hypothetical protein